jgi:CubicO group peptidase (beta-lactamase class C family)
MATRDGNGSTLSRGAVVVSLRAFTAFGVLGALALPLQAQLNEDRPDFEQQLSYALVRNAKQLCSVIFVVGRTPEQAMKIGDITRWEGLNAWWRWHKIDVRIDLERKRVTLARYPAPPRTAVFHESQGCIMLPAGEDRVFFDPIAVPPKLPPADQTPWPMGDAPDGKKVVGIKPAAVEAALDSAFKDNNPEAGERGWVVLHDGLIVGERYAPGYDKNTRNLSFSAGKSIEATLVGILVRDGHLNVNDRAPIAEWAAPDARSLITIQNLMNMASGLACNNYGQEHPLHFTPQDHHSIGYNDGIDAVQASISVPLRFVPGKTYRYLNCDLLAVGKIVRQAVEQAYDVEYLAFPQRYLFDKIGARNSVLEPDPYGNFLLNGHNYISTRDWARFGQLYLQDGLFNGERVLPEGWAKFVATPSPANRGYGAFFWLATARSGLPRDAYWASGAEGNQTVILPSHGVVVAKNAWSPVKDFNRLVRMIADAVVKAPSDCQNNGWRAYGFDNENQCVTYVDKRGSTPLGPIAP